MTEPIPWRRCSACKKPIATGAVYWVCSVSTCNRERTALAFCTVECWEVHLPSANHREAWAVERKAPASPQPPPKGSTGGSAERGVRRVLVRESSPATDSKERREILIIASRLKDYIRARSGYNTSDGVLDPLSDIVRRVCDDAIKAAQRDGRMTVLDRDVPKD
ncbi:MAG TPA: hypothetical protein VNE71_10730 [Myxococcota bacterium]|nr:hypothetical protein [Myxococcota bacterium]